MCTDQAGPEIPCRYLRLLHAPVVFLEPEYPTVHQARGTADERPPPPASPMPASGTNVVVCVLVLVVAIVTAILLAFSFKDIDADEQVPAPTLVPVE